MKKWIFIVASGIGLALILFFVLKKDPLPIETNISETVADFSFTTQDHETVSNEDLEGGWWIADFVFTNCETVCLPMTYHMSLLQTGLEEKQLPVELVSFSVDPDYDTPEVLKEYGELNDADFSNWHFLTGYDFKTIKELSIKSFRAWLKEPEYGSDQVTHDTRLFLVDPEGNIVKGYDGVEQESIDLILNDLEKLQKNNLLSSSE